MAQHGSFSARKDSGEGTPKRVEVGRSDRVDARKARKQPPRLDPVPNRTGADPRGQQLRPADHSVLPFGETGYRGVRCQDFWCHNNQKS